MRYFCIIHASCVSYKTHMNNLVSGIQPSGRLHIGNWLGALKNFVALQNSGDYACHFFVADLHSLTEDFDPAQKKTQTLDVLASFIAAGIDPKKSLVFVQSHVPAHSELAWILDTIAPFGDLSRMTQFKDKSSRQACLSGRQEENTNLGLFAYPVLMAADILLYDAVRVPVGEDQVQHLELARTLARKFNAKFGETFIEPQALMTPEARVMSLSDPLRKMSKSEPAGCLFLDDSPEEIKAKLIAAVTDSGSGIAYDPETKPGISNLIAILSGVTSTPITDLAQEHADAHYSSFKATVAKAVIKKFAAFRKKKEKLLANPDKLIKIAARGAKAANLAANAKIKTIRERIGLL